MEEVVEGTSPHEGYSDPRDAGTTATKERYGKLLHRSQKCCGLHDLLSHHHMPSGERIQGPVGDISQIKGGEG